MTTAVTVVVMLAVMVFSAPELEEVSVEVELEDELTERIPPATPPGGDVDGVVAFLARRAKAARVLPVAGAFMAATMPDWQWFPVVWPQ